MDKRHLLLAVNLSYMRDPRLIPGTQKRIENCDYEALFAHGGCFHFALRLHERFGYQVRGLRNSPSERLSHVWCIKNGTRQGIDIRGIFDEELIVRLANGGKPSLPSDVSAGELRTLIASNEYPDALDNKMRELADWVVDTHERFECVKSLPDGAYEDFCKNLENGEPVSIG